MQWRSFEQQEEDRRFNDLLASGERAAAAADRDREAMLLETGPSCRTCYYDLLPRLAVARGETLIDLYFFGGGPSDADLKHLAGFPKLQKLNLGSATAITDDGVRSLAVLTTLTELVLPSSNAGITAAAVAELQTALPGCTISGGPAAPKPPVPPAASPIPSPTTGGPPATPPTPNRPWWKFW